MKLFDLDSKFMHYANKFADLMWLNVLTLVCCIPIVTAGASLTAMHRVLLAVYRDEESYITKMFFKSFKENFRQSTVIWLIYVLVFGVLISDFVLIVKNIIELPKIFTYALIFAAAAACLSFIWVFVLQSRYQNTIKNTIKNSLVVAVSQILYSVMMLLMTILPVLAVYLWEQSVPFIFVFGLTVPGILQTMLYSKVFDKLEGVDRKALQQADDGWTVELEQEAEQKSDGTEAVQAGETLSEDGQVDEKSEK